MDLLILSFVAGALTVLAPCILPLLPIIVGGSLGNDTERNWRKPFVITASLAVSVVVFTLLLKASTSLLGVPVMVWQLLSGATIMLLGALLLWPNLWEKVGVKLQIGSNQLLGSAGKRKGLTGEILTGAALGPVFSSCSPTYALIVASILPASFGEGLIYLATYALGLSAVLLLVAILGQKLVSRLNWASNPKGWFKRGLGIVFIIVGFLIATGLEHQLEAYLVEQGWYDPFAELEHTLRR